MNGRQPAVPDGCHLIALDSVGSTNEHAKGLAHAGAPAGTAVWAREQTAGRGRHGRTWHSPPGNSYLSLLLRPACTPSEASQLGFVAGVALADTVSQFGATTATLKWPNDLMLAGKKASGILLESAAAPDGRLDWVVVGIGVNVASSPSDIPDVTSLQAEGVAVSVEAFVEALLARFFAGLALWQAEGFAPVRQRWLDFAAPSGSPLRVRLPTGDVSGKFSGIDARGSLLLETDGGVRRVDVGDVFPAAPAGERVG